MTVPSRFLALWLLLWLLPPAAHAQPATGPSSTDAEKLLQAKKVATDATGLLEFFRRNTPTSAEEKDIDRLIGQLGNRSYRVRAKAAQALTAHGPRALAHLHLALSKVDLETQVSLEKCIREITANADPEVYAAATRLLGARKPDQAPAVLLQYLPYAWARSIQSAVLETLVKVATGSDRVHPALLASLQDPALARRAAAAFLVGKYGSAEDRKKVRQLLTDPEALVRLHAAQGLLAAQDTSGVPVLLAILGDGPYAAAQKADEVLQLLAAGAGPRVSLADEKHVRQKCQAAWRRWWQDTGGKLDWSEVSAAVPWESRLAGAQQVSQRFVHGLLAGNLRELEEATAIPFYIGSMPGGHVKINSREDFNKIFRDAGQSAAAAIKVEILASIPAAEYLPRASQKNQDLLRALGTTDLYVVTVAARTSQLSRQERLALLIRRQRGRPLVVGFMGER